MNTLASAQMNISRYISIGETILFIALLVTLELSNAAERKSQAKIYTFCFILLGAAVIANAFISAK